MLLHFFNTDDSIKSASFQIITNTILVIITFWFGFAVQFFISDSQRNNSEILYKMESSEKLMPYQNELDQIIKSIGIGQICDSIYMQGFSQILTRKSKQAKNIDIFLSQKIHDSSYIETLLNGVNNLLNLNLYLQYLPSNRKTQKEINKEMYNLASCYHICKFYYYPDYDIDRELLSYKYRQLTNVVLTKSMSELLKQYNIDESTTDEIKTTVIRMMLSSSFKLYNLFYYSLDVNVNTSKSFWENSKVKISLLLLPFFILLSILVSYVLIRKVLKKGEFVSEAMYHQVSIENNHLKIELEQSRASIQTLSSLINSITPESGNNSEES